MDQEFEAPHVHHANKWNALSNVRLADLRAIGLYLNIKVFGGLMFIHYKVKYFDEVDFQENEEEGITSGNDINDTVEKISDYYGKNNISSMYLDYEFGNSFTTDDDCTLLIMNK